MTHHPTNIAGTKIGFTRLALVNQIHTGRQRYGVTTRIALHALGLARGAGGVQGVTGVGGVYPSARHVVVQVLRSALAPQSIALFYPRHGSQLAVHHQHALRLVTRELYGLVQQRFVGHHLATARTGIGADHHLGLGVFNACGQRARRKTAEHHRMDGPNSCTSQHGKGGLWNHGHVNQHPIALLHAQAFKHGRHTLHFSVQLRIGVDLFLVGFGAYKNQGRLVSTSCKVAVYRVVAKVGGAAHKPAGKRRLAVVANLLRWHLPINALGLLCPKFVWSVYRLAIKLTKSCFGSGHGAASLLLECLPEFVFFNYE